LTYPYAHGCGPDPDRRVDKYWKYKNPDPSTSIYTPIIVEKILRMTEEVISSEAKRIYHIRSEAILARDLRHSVMRELAYRSHKEVLKIDRFEQENSGDIRNFDSEEQKE
jgi:hypothetical protein